MACILHALGWHSRQCRQALVYNGCGGAHACCHGDGSIVNFVVALSNVLHCSSSTGG